MRARVHSETQTRLEPGTCPYIHIRGLNQLGYRCHRKIGRERDRKKEREREIEEEKEKERDREIERREKE